jgi:hypothetical protein
MLNLVENLGEKRKTNITAYLICPYSDDERTDIKSDMALRKAYAIFDYTRVTNLPNYSSGSVKPRWRLKWFDNSMTDPEKQIIWEILRNERNTIQPVKEAL